MQHQSPRPGASGRPSIELRRAISRPAWFANRARNAVQRPVFIAAITAGTFVTAIVATVVGARARDAAPMPSLPRPDTLSVAANAALARIRLASAESTLVAARAQIAADSAAAAQQLAADTLLGLSPGVIDSLEWRLRTLDRLRLRTVQAPLPTSYRALADAPELRDDPRIRALIDSLTEIERERQGFGAVGGVDPVFVALTARANEIGKSIVAIADERRNDITSQLQPQVPRVTIAAPIDTSAPATLRDSARTAFQTASGELTRRRAASRAVDIEEQRARARALAIAPPLAMLASAFVLSAAIGFAVAFIGELRKPRVSDANELERYLGVRVLSTIETSMPSVERGRRQFDRNAPPYFDPGAEGYQLAYLAIATDHPELLMVTVTGDHPGITAVIGCNMAAVAADEARNTLVVDLDPTCSTSAVLRAPARPGITDIASHNTDWPDVTIPASVGRDKTISLVPHGVGNVPPEQVIGVVRDGAERFARYYDAVFLLASAAHVAAGLPSAIPAPEVVYCAQPGITPLRQLRGVLDQIRRAGGIVRGIVLWHTERPMLPTPRELSGKARTDRNVQPPVPAAI